MLAQIVRRKGMSRLSIAMRAWADSDPRALAAVQRHDEIVLGFLGDCLMARGFSQHEAQVRGYALMSLGLSKIYAPGLDMATLFEDMIQILCHPAP